MEADTLYVAGEAEPGALVRVFANDEFVGEAAAGDAGAWLIEAPSEVPVGDVVIRADVADPNAAAPGEQVELPFRRFADGMVLEPVATASAEALWPPLRCHLRLFLSSGAAIIFGGFRGAIMGAAYATRRSSRPTGS